MVRIALLTPSITTRDAVSNDVVGMYNVLRKRGYDVQVFAEGWTIRQPRVSPPSEVQRFLKKPEDLLIYHYSRGWEPGLELLQRVKCRTVVRYHNITPPEYFAPYNSDYAEMCRAGRGQLHPIANAGCDLYVSASAYNMRELLAHGAAPQRSFVVPPFHQIDRLRLIVPDRNLLDQFNDDSTNICMVGRVSPNKGHPALIEAFAAYYHDYNQRSRLIIVGKEETRLAIYSLLLRELIKRLDLKGKVIFVGEVSDHGLKACYASAHVFMTTSNHEGFCVPLIEAMALKIPILAYASSAIPETVGGAGLVWDEHDPYLLAESINAIATNRRIGAALGKLGKDRYHEHYTNEKIETKMLLALDRLL